MKKYEFSEHARGMLRERNIKESWVTLTIENPDKKELKNNETIHYIKRIVEHGNRYLRVVVNPNVNPQIIITLFFDRRLRGRA